MMAIRCVISKSLLWVGLSSMIMSLMTSSSIFATGADVAADTHKMCKEWANSGECDKNPAYMLVNCATSCNAIIAAIAKEEAEISAIGSFFDLSADDIHGNKIDFNRYRGQVTILTNVASYCGYTESHYKGLVELWGKVKDAPINILAFPCNQFGKQEPGTAEEIEEFAKAKGVQFTIMSKINVNGPNASIVYKYLKKQTSTSSIQWNFASYFVVEPDGTITAHHGVEPMDLLEYSLGLLRNEEL